MAARSTAGLPACIHTYYSSCLLSTHGDLAGLPRCCDEGQGERLEARLPSQKTVAAQQQTMKAVTHWGALHSSHTRCYTSCRRHADVAESDKSVSLGGKVQNPFKVDQPSARKRPRRVPGGGGGTPEPTRLVRRLLP